MNTEEATKVCEGALGIPHLRVLRLLYDTDGMMTRTRISKEIDMTIAYVGVAVGYSDPVKRAKFLATPMGKANGIPLLDREYVREVEVDVDGVSETCLVITATGKAAYEENIEKLEQYDKDKADAGCYNWPRLLDGQIYRLIRGEDYRCKDTSLQACIYFEARRRGLTAQVKIVKEGIVLKANPKKDKQPKKSMISDSSVQQFARVSYEDE